MGPGWRTNFDQVIRPATGPRTAAATDPVSGVGWVRADGREDFFARDSSCGAPGGGRHSGGPATHDEVVCWGNHYEATDTANVAHVFDPEGRLGQVRDRHGNGYGIGRDSAGRPQDVTSTAGQKIHLEYDSEGQLASATSSDGVTVNYTMAGGRLVSVTKPGGLVYSYSYDSLGRLKTIRDPTGTITYQQNLDAGRVGSQSDGRENSTSFSYQSGPTFGSSEAKVQDARGGVQRSIANSVEFETARTNQEGNTTRFGYDSAGNRASITDAIGASTATTFNSAGNPVSVRAPDGSMTTSRYRADHQVSDTTDPTGRTTRFEYNDRGVLTSVDPSGPAGASISVPNADGSISATLSPDGFITRTEYDERGRAVRRIDAGNRSSHTQFNPDGTVAATTAPGGLVSTTQYDSARRPTRIDAPGGAVTTFGYDTAGNQVSVTDPTGNETRFGYDAAYNLYETSATIEGGEVIRARFGYDEENRLTATTEPGAAGTTEMAYSPAGRLASVTDADGATWAYEYSPRGELTAVTSPDGTRHFSHYDATGRLTKSGNESDGYATYSYDPAGRPTGSVDATGRETSYTYDDSGRPIAIADRAEGQSRPTEFRSTLSPGGRRDGEARIYYSAPAPGLVTDEVTTIDYSYGDDGALGHISSPALIGAGEISLTTDPTTGWAYSASGPGNRVVFSYDSAGRVTERTTTLGTGPNVKTITSPTAYDASGNVTSLGSWSYTYDKLSRLVKAEDSATSEVFEYQYDAASNRRQVKRNDVVVQSLSFGAANRIDTAASPEFAYDSTGRLISDTAGNGHKRHYIWDRSSRLIGIDLYLPETGHYRNLRMSYDASGKMVQKDTYLNLTYLAERLYFHYDGTRLVGEADEDGIVREYLYSGGEAPASMRARNSDGSYSNLFFVTNTHGDVVAVTDRDGNIVNRYAYGPWGEATRVSEQVHQPFRYAGYRYEDGFDLYYLRARWYDASTGRFLSRDPVRGNQMKPLTLNRYAYAESCPASLADPTGLSPIPCRQGIYVLAEHIDSMYETHVKGRPNDATNVGHMMDAIYGVFGGPGNDFSLFDIDANGEPLFSMPGNTGWKSEYVDEDDPTHHFISFLYYGWIDFAGLVGTQLAYEHEAEPYFFPPFSASGAGGTQEDYRLSKAALRLGYEVRLGADWKVRSISFSGGGIKASELSGEILRRLSTGDCKASAVWATPFF
ncbi:MAG: hypothetical protein DCC49_13440 [Acidobacteria bacterium]|nr:MAG: hypothetical protein DCC49_13440 [Acidobacteriota bacterium]